MREERRQTGDERIEKRDERRAEREERIEKGGGRREKREERRAMRYEGDLDSGDQDSVHTEADLN